MTVTAHAVSRNRRQQNSLLQRGFSLTELLVVIGIIVLLLGIVLVALRPVRVRAQRTDNQATMQMVINACTSFEAEHGRYPGVVDDATLAATTSPRTLSSTENMLLDLMGGWRIRHESQNSGPVFQEWDEYRSAALSTQSMLEFTLGASPNRMMLVVDRRKIGEGSRINGKGYQPYFTPTPAMLGATKGQLTDPNGAGMFDLLDTWGQPIIYVRRSRPQGPLAADPAASAAQPQFSLAGVYQYLRRMDNDSPGLGEMQMYQQSHSSQANPPRFSMFNISQISEAQRNMLWAVVLGHPASHSPPSGSNPNQPLYGAARGSIALISAGQDGIFFSVNDGPGTNRAPISAQNVVEKVITPGPRILSEFNDMVFFGGS